MSVAIRPFQPFDLPALYRVCLLTGDSGKDATPLYRDPELIGHLYAGPYPLADPALTFVATDGQGVLGYVLATADTAAFEKWQAAHWWPELRERYPEVGDPGDGSRDWTLVRQINRPYATDAALLADYPAHLHIDLLPRGQGAGLGRKLITTLFAALRERGVPGVHLGVGARNPGARAFYLRLGFTELRRDDAGSTMAYDLSGV
ncbi:MAG: GNAT family N-acetyltransferase [Nonomuraea sp.]|nr:GNAT family N-acetyltransferase [Nonomuraea sp.]